MPFIYMSGNALKVAHLLNNVTDKNITRNSMSDDNLHENLLYDYRTPCEEDSTTCTSTEARLFLLTRPGAT